MMKGRKKIEKKNTKRKKMRERERDFVTDDKIFEEKVMQKSWNGTFPRTIVFLNFG